MTERLTAKELSELERLWESNRNEKWNHEAAVSLGCVVRPVLPRLIAMAQRLLELESAKSEAPLSVRVQLTDSGEFAFYPFARRATHSEGSVCSCGHRRWAHNKKGFCNTCSCGKFTEPEVEARATYLDEQVEFIDRWLIHNAADAASVHVLRALFRSAIDVTHECGSEKSTRDAYLDTIVQAFKVLEHGLGEKGYIE